MDNYLTISQALDNLDISPTLLSKLIENGTIRAITFEGETLVNEADVMPNLIKKSDFKSLRRVPITVSQASEKYDVPRNTIFEWINKGFISVLTPGYRTQIDESDMAYCARIYHEHGGGRGARIFDVSGRPYRMKDEKRAIYRREYRKRKAIIQ